MVEHVNVFSLGALKSLLCVFWPYAWKFVVLWVAVKSWRFYWRSRRAFNRDSAACVKGGPKCKRL